MESGSLGSINDRWLVTSAESVSRQIVNEQISDRKLYCKQGARERKAAVALKQELWQLTTEDRQLED